jgi:hypothetical protein
LLLIWAYYHFALSEGVSAPLGWALSEGARRQMDDMLDTPCHKTQMEELVQVLRPREDGVAR